MMVPDDENVSAFAVYSGKVKLSKKQKKRNKMKGNKNLENPLTKVDKIEIINKKKEKKERILKGKTNNSSILDDDLPVKKDKVKSKKSKMLLSLNKSSDESPKLTKKKKKKKSKSNSDTNSSAEIKNSAENSTIDETSAKPEAYIASEEGSLVNITYNIPTKSSNLKTAGTKKKSTKRVKLLCPDLVEKDDDAPRKMIVSTPRFKRKPTSKLQEISDMDRKPGVSGILRKVDSFNKEKKRANRILTASEGSLTYKERQSSVMLKLAEQARQEIQKQGSSVTHGQLALEKILQSYSLDTFMRDNWEKKPVHIVGNTKDKFLNLLSTEVVDSILRENIVLFGKHLDVTMYVDGKRETHNMEGRAHAHVVWDFYSNGCSVRLLNPQYFLNTVHTLNSHLQEYFGCFVGANVYLTPPNSQGFAPHYDDIEAFILQVEGSKLWRIYSPINKDGYLPRYSSRNLTEDEIGDPIMEVKLSPGDVLYFPRGYIHQGRTEDEHSLHITLSVYQKTAWCDLLEKLLPLTLKKAAAHDVEFRKGMPLGYLTGAGLAFKKPSQMRKQLVTNLKKLVTRLTDFLEVDSAVDEMGLSYIKDALPPVLTPEEAACSITGGGWRMGRNGALSNQVNFSLETRVRWIRAYCYRILEEDVTLEDGTIERQTRIYYTLDNSREYHKDEPQFVIIPPNMVPAALHLASIYPEFSKISDLPGSDDDEKVTLVGDLWDRGLVMTNTPLEVVDDSEDVGEVSRLTKEEMEVVLDLEENIPGVDSEVAESSDDEDDKTVEIDSEESVPSLVDCSEKLGDDDGPLTKSLSDNEDDVDNDGYNSN